MLNTVVLMGRLTKDPELKYTTTNNTPVLSFSLAVDRRYAKDKEQGVDFINLVAWQGTAEFVSRNFTQGQPMLVEGRLQQRKYVDSAGKTQYVYEVIAEDVHFAGFKREDSRNNDVGYDENFDPYAGQVAA